jgi:hypothetical protein
LISDGLNGLPIVRFNGTSNYLRNATAELLTNNATQFTIYIVSNMEGSGSRFTFLYGDDSRRQIVHQRFENAELYYGDTGFVNYGSVPLQSNWAIRGWVYNGALSGNSNRLKIYRNGTQLSPSYTNTIVPNLGTLVHGYYIASRSNLTDVMQTDIAGIYLFPSALTDSDRHKLEGYIAHQRGLTANLAADHPYKNNPPVV